MIEVLGIDPRAYSNEKLVAPKPLPFLSRSALKRVRDRLVPPTCCHFCKGEVQLVSNGHIYGREYGEWGLEAFTELKTMVGLSYA